MIYQLAPMESVSCWAFRVLCTRFGADRTYTEMVRAKTLGRDNNASWSLIDTFGEEECHVQLAANNTQEIDAFFLTLEEFFSNMLTSDLQALSIWAPCMQL